jgi:DNA-binding response OmpR family regulator
MRLVSLRRTPYDVHMPSPSVVLVVDDHADHGEMLQIGLDSAGYRTVLARSCVEGARIVTTQRVDVVIADFSLGDGTAVDLMRMMGARRPLVAIVLSGRDDAYVVTQSLSAGYDAHLGKGTPLPTLVAMIERYVGRRKSGLRLKKTDIGPTKKKSSG